MAIQNRRGAYVDLNPAKAVPGELLVVQSGDPNATDGKAVYMTFGTGDIKRLATDSDVATMVADATDEIVQDLEDTVEGYADRAETAATSAESILESAEATIEAKGAEQIEAVEAQGAETIASIPEDYTELTEDVEVLKNTTVIDNAKQLLSDNYIEDKVPYLFRPAGGDGADRAIDTIVGGSVVWNQLADHDNPYAFNTNYISYDENTHIYTATYPEGSTYSSDVLSFSADDFIDGHVYYNNFKIIDDSNYVAMRFYFPGGTTSATNIDTLRNYSNAGGLVWRSTLTRFRLNKSSGTTSAQSISFKYQYFDLTRMFGATIADYIYSLEQTTLGSGIAKLKSWGFFTKDYYEYNAGELMSVGEVSAKKTVVFNQFDKNDFTVFYAYLHPVSTGNYEWAQLLDSRSVVVRCLPNTVYYISIKGTPPNIFRCGAITVDLPSNPTSGGWRISLEKEFSASTNGVLTYVTGENAKWLIVQIGSQYFTNGLVAENLCINISDPDKNGTYEPYVRHTYPLDSTLTLRGIPKLDADNNLYYDGDEYASDGSVKRKYGVVDLGTLTWSYVSNKYFQSISINTAVKSLSNATIPNAVCSAYTFVAWNDSSASSGNIAINTNGTISCINSTYTDAANFKTAMSGVYLIYELATLTSETAEPYVNPQVVDPSGTEEYVTTSIVPVGHVTKYHENIKAKIDGLPWDLSMIAPIDNGTTATRAYSTGQYFMHGNQLCKAKKSIASGATFTLNTNYEVTTVAAELYSVLH